MTTAATEQATPAPAGTADGPGAACVWEKLMADAAQKGRWERGISREGALSDPPQIVLPGPWRDSLATIVQEHARDTADHARHAKHEQAQAKLRKVAGHPPRYDGSPYPHRHAGRPLPPEPRWEGTCEPVLAAPVPEYRTPPAPGFAQPLPQRQPGPSLEGYWEAHQARADRAAEEAQRRAEDGTGGAR